jgi:hypothetical protein
MRKPALLAVSLVLVSPFAAAQGYDPSPRGLLSTEGRAASWFFGAYNSSRFMYLDSELRGKGGLIKEVAYRADYRAHNSVLEIGRSWSRVTVDLSDCDRTKASTTFSLNPTSTPTRVFSGAAAWPTLSGFPHSQPAPFGATNGRLRFPFQRNWVYSGTTDICLDVDFDGGTLANGGGWNNGQQRPYYLDGYGQAPDSVHGATAQYGRSLTSGGCVSQGAYNGWGGYAKVDSTTFTPNSPQHPNSTRVTVTTLGTTPNQPLVLVLSTGGSPAGVPFPGVTCNRLHLDLAVPYVTTIRQPSPPYGLTNFDFAIFTYQPALAGRPLYLQGAWTDPGTKGLMLTNGARTTVPAMPMARLRTCVYTSVVANKNTVGTGLLTVSDYHPVARFAR